MPSADNRNTVRTVIAPPTRQQSICRRFLLLLILCPILCLLIGSPTLHAQFAGPALSSTSPRQNPVVPTTAPELLYPQNQALYLNPGDVVAVHIYGSLDYTPTARVTLEGTLQLPLVGVISVKGLTIDQAENLIASRLKALGMFLDPQVTLDVTESLGSSVTIAGEAHAVVPVAGQRTLLAVLASAGGLPPTASHIITIDRPGLDKPIVVDLGTDPLRSVQSNIPVYPGDTIITSRVGVVYLLGQFKIDGAIPIVQNSPLTLLEAASLGGGTLFSGKYKDLRIIRTVDGQRSLVRVDMKQVMLGHAPDPILQADDIVFLPTSLLKAAISANGLGIILAAASTAVFAIPYL